MYRLHKKVHKKAPSNGKEKWQAHQTELLAARRLIVNKKKWFQGKIRPTSCIFDHDF
jgi:hypothetical protein